MRRVNQSEAESNANQATNMNVNPKEPAYWYVLSDGIEQGPMNVTEIMERLKSGALNEDSLVRLDAWEKTVRLARLGGVEEMRRLERGGHSKRVEDSSQNKNSLMQDAEVVRLQERLRWVRRIEKLGLVVIAALALFGAAMVVVGGGVSLSIFEVKAKGATGFVVLGLVGLVLLEGVVKAAIWIVLTSIAGGAVSGALSSRCLWLERSEGGYGERRRVRQRESERRGLLKRILKDVD